MEIIQWVGRILSDYVDSQNQELIDTITDIRSPAYTYIFLWIFIKIYREITFNKK